MGFKKHGVGEILGTEGKTGASETAKTAVVTVTSSLTGADTAAIIAEGQEEEEEF